ncbi:MAG: aminotransferase class I/II-fold pyridoxal phosphate-dependent enzyme [Leeuwenhoekiella sp.]
MANQKNNLNTVCVHTGEVKDTQFKGAISPIFMSTSYAFEDVEMKRYPRSFNSPNQEKLENKIAALEGTESGMIFGSGMAAVTTTMLAFLKAGDHVVLQKTLYGGTQNMIREELSRCGITYTLTEDLSREAFAKAIQENTKVLYTETPSNPLMTVTDLQMVGDLANKHGLVSMVDNTFASPVNQNPRDFGIDIIIHSATKYMGGHSDITAGAVACSAEHREMIWQRAVNFGGSLSDFTVWMLERSLKTLVLRVRQQSENALQLAQWLEKQEQVAKVYYPGLESHPNHAIAKKQMSGFGGMLSFELAKHLDADTFQKELKMIKSSMSLAGVESTILSPAKTSHFLLTQEERDHQGISDGLLRFSTGIEEVEEIIADIEQAFRKL